MSWNIRCCQCGRFISKKIYDETTDYYKGLYGWPLILLCDNCKENFNQEKYLEHSSLRSGLKLSERKEDEKNNSPLAEWSSIWPTPRRKRFDSFRGYQKIKQKIKHFLLKFIFPELDD